MNIRKNRINGEIRNFECTLSHKKIREKILQKKKNKQINKQTNNEVHKILLCSSHTSAATCNIISNKCQTLNDRTHNNETRINRKVSKLNARI